MGFLFVFIGGGLGAAARHGVNLLASKIIRSDFPFATLAINVFGSFLMGLFVGYFAFRGEASQHCRLFLTTGLLGGFTTFSAFSLECVLLYERGAWLAAGAYALASVALAVAALVSAIWLMRV